MTWRTFEVLKRLKEAGRTGTIRGDDIHVDGPDGRSAVIRVANPVDMAWWAGDEKIEVIGGSMFADRLVSDVGAWIDRGERIYRDIPIIRRRGR